MTTNGTPSTSRPRSLSKTTWVATRVIRWCLRLLAGSRIAPVTVTDRHYIVRPGAFIVVANHRSMMDFVYLFGALRRNVAALGMAELWNNRLVGALANATGQIPVKRGDRESGQQATDQMTRVLELGGVVALFPEGRISKTEHLLPFKSGAYYLSQKTGAPVVPVGMRDIHRVLRLTKRFPRFWRRTSITFGEPLYAKDFPNRSAFMEELTLRVAHLSQQELPLPEA